MLIQQGIVEQNNDNLRESSFRIKRCDNNEMKIDMKHIKIKDVNEWDVNNKDEIVNSYLTGSDNPNSLSAQYESTQNAHK